MCGFLILFSYIASLYNSVVPKVLTPQYPKVKFLSIWMIPLFSKVY